MYKQPPEPKSDPEAIYDMFYVGLFPSWSLWILLPVMWGVFGFMIYAMIKTL